MGEVTLRNAAELAHTDNGIKIVDHELPIDVAHDAVAGELLCGDEDAFERFKAKIDARFETERDDLRQHQRAVIDRIAEEGLRG